MRSNSKEFYWNLGNRIRNIRINKNYTVEEVSELVGISTKYLYQIENGRVSFSTEILYNIANSLEVSTDILLYEKKNDVENSILTEISGKFTQEEKEYIRRILIQNFIQVSCI